jgi:hypothetical protein
MERDELKVRAARRRLDKVEMTDEATALFIALGSRMRTDFPDGIDELKDMLRDARITPETWHAFLDDFVDDAELVAVSRPSHRGSNRPVTKEETHSRENACTRQRTRSSAVP